MRLPLSNGYTVSPNFDTGLLTFRTRNGRTIYVNSELQNALLEYFTLVNEMEAATSTFRGESDDFIYFFGLNTTAETVKNSEEVVGELVDEFTVGITVQELHTIIGHGLEIPEHVKEDDPEKIQCRVLKYTKEKE